MTRSIGHASTLSGTFSGIWPSSLGFEESVSGASRACGQCPKSSRTRDRAVELFSPLQRVVRGGRGRTQTPPTGQGPVTAQVRCRPSRATAGRGRSRPQGRRAALPAGEQHEKDSGGDGDHHDHDERGNRGGDRWAESHGGQRQGTAGEGRPGQGQGAGSCGDERASTCAGSGASPATWRHGERSSR